LAKSSGKKYKILIAEDNMLNQKLLTIMLERHNLDFITAKEGGEVINKFISEKPDLILMDIGMPELNGYDAALEIRRLEKDKKNKIPIIAVTGHSSAEEIDMIKKAGMDDYVVKPFDFNNLLEKINSHLKSKN
jgi:CheY-like chemotaxis protein